ncbi:hypothetical protein RHECNPAF_122100152 [Rhizobium etli CNPAF512]|nr:hypothetical protein RHECNPAF_122100152 [Rhizobium etli CNPAF512]
MITSLPYSPTQCLWRPHRRRDPPFLPSVSEDVVPLAARRCRVTEPFLRRRISLSLGIHDDQAFAFDALPTFHFLDEIDSAIKRHRAADGDFELSLGRERDDFTHRRLVLFAHHEFAGAREEDTHDLCERRIDIEDYASRLAEPALLPDRQPTMRVENDIELSVLLRRNWLPVVEHSVDTDELTSLSLHGSRTMPDEKSPL